MKKMKKTRVLLVLEVTIPLLVLQFSCATVEKKEVEEAPPEKPVAAEEAPAAKKLLEDTHKAAKISCNTCHEKMPPKDEIPNTVCLACHADYRELTASNKNPHDAHKAFPNCGDCHHMHKPSKVQCLSCHEFDDMQTP